MNNNYIVLGTMSGGGKTNKQTKEQKQKQNKTKKQNKTQQTKKKTNEQTKSNILYVSDAVMCCVWHYYLCFFSVLLSID